MTDHSRDPLATPEEQAALDKVEAMYERDRGRYREYVEKLRQMTEEK